MEKVVIYVDIPGAAEEQLVVSYIGKMIGDENAVEIAAEEYRKYRSHNNYCVLLCRNELSEPIGFTVINLEPYEGFLQVAEIVFLNIDEPYRGRGIAREFLSKIEGNLREKNIEAVLIKVNTKNKGAVKYWISCDYYFESHLRKIAKENSYYLMRKDIGQEI